MSVLSLYQEFQPVPQRILLASLLFSPPVRADRRRESAVSAVLPLTPQRPVRRLANTENYYLQALRVPQEKLLDLDPDDGEASKITSSAVPARECSGAQNYNL